MHTLPSRRQALGALAAASMARPLSARAQSNLKLGVMDGTIGQPCMPESVASAAALGLAGVQVTMGSPQPSGGLLLSDSGLQHRFLEASKRYNVALPNTYLDILHKDCLKDSSTQALRWIREGVKATKALGADVLMLVFFGKCAVDDEADRKAIVTPLREGSRMAQDAGILLGFETTVSAPANLAIVEAVNSPAFKIWYDIGNSTNMGHFNVAEEIRLLGRERICGIHIKDKVYLDAGAVQVRAALEAIRDIGYKGFVMLETSAPTGDRMADLRKNLDILQRDISQVGV